MDRRLTASPPLTVDVESDHARQLRRRLQAQAEASEIMTAAVLPGGAILEDGPEGLTYHFQADGEWSLAAVGAETRFTHPAGHVLAIREGRIRLTLAK